MTRAEREDRLTDTFHDCIRETGKVFDAAAMLDEESAEQILKGNMHDYKAMVTAYERAMKGKMKHAQFRATAERWYRNVRNGLTRAVPAVEAILE